MKKYNLSDDQWAELSKQGYNLAGVESAYGQSIRYKVKKYTPDSILNIEKRILRGEDSPNSRGLSQIKFNPKDNKIYESFGITENNTKNNPFNQGRATMIKLAEVNKGLGHYHWKDGSDMTDTEARAIVWNRGRVTDYANENNGKNASGYVKKYYNRSRL